MHQLNRTETTGDVSAIYHDRDNWEAERAHRSDLRTIIITNSAVEHLHSIAWGPSSNTGEEWHKPELSSASRSSICTAVIRSSDRHEGKHVVIQQSMFVFRY